VEIAVHYRMYYAQSGVACSLLLTEKHADAGCLEVLATTGDAKLGGDDWDRALMQWVLQQHPEDSAGSACQFCSRASFAGQARPELGLSHVVCTPTNALAAFMSSWFSLLECTAMALHFVFSHARKSLSGIT